MRSWIRVRNNNSNLNILKTIVDIHAVKHVTSQQNARKSQPKVRIWADEGFSLLAGGFSWCRGNGETLRMFGYPTISDGGIILADETCSLLVAILTTRILIGGSTELGIVFKASERRSSVTVFDQLLELKKSTHLFRNQFRDY